MDTLQPATRTQFQRARLQNFKEVVFVVAVLERAVDEYYHLILRIA